MKIVIINDFVTWGGAEIYSRNLKRLFEEKGHKCFYLYLKDDSEKIGGKDQTFFKLGKERYHLSEKLLKDRKVYRQMKEWLRKMQPDVVVVNNLFLSPVAVWKALRGYKVFQVVHDYHPFCPKSTCLRDDGEVCSENKEIRRCFVNCTYHGSKAILLLKYAVMQRVNRLRAGVLAGVIAPSERLARSLAEDRTKPCVLNNPISIRVQKEALRYKENRIFLYMGGISEIKGAFLLIEAFQEWGRPDAELMLAGPAASEEDIRRLKILVEKSDNIRYLGRVKHEELQKLIQKAYAVVVPSNCMENYPTTVLEGMANGTLVIGSDIGGISEQLASGRGILCTFRSRNALVESLEYSNQLSRAQYLEIIRKAYDYVYSNNCEEQYYRRFMEIIEGRV